VSCSWLLAARLGCSSTCEVGVMGVLGMDESSSSPIAVVVYCASSWGRVPHRQIRRLAPFTRIRACVLRSSCCLGYSLPPPYAL
jgi:hypothetical protein